MPLEHTEERESHGEETGPEMERREEVGVSVRAAHIVQPELEGEGGGGEREGEGTAGMIALSRSLGSAGAARAKRRKAEGRLTGGQATGR